MYFHRPDTRTSQWHAPGVESDLSKSLHTFSGIFWVNYQTFCSSFSLSIFADIEMYLPLSFLRCEIPSSMKQHNSKLFNTTVKAQTWFLFHSQSIGPCSMTQKSRNWSRARGGRCRGETSLWRLRQSWIWDTCSGIPMSWGLSCLKARSLLSVGWEKHMNEFPNLHRLRCVGDKFLVK